MKHRNRAFVTLKGDVVQEVREMARKRHRSVTQQVMLLLTEALTARKSGAEAAGPAKDGRVSGMFPVRSIDDYEQRDPEVGQ